MQAKIKRIEIKVILPTVKKYIFSQVTNTIYTFSH